MKTITILCLHLGYGGIEKYISSLCEMLKDDFKIKIISTYKIYDEPVFYIDKKIDIEYLIECKPCKEEMYESLKNKQIFSFINYGIKNAKLLYLKNKLNIEAIKKIDSDFIITTRDFHNHLVSKYANNNITKIATEHNHHNNNEKYINNLIKSIKGFDYFVLVSKELQNFYKNKVENTKCLYIPNVIEKINDEPLNNYNHNLISIGRLSKEKGFDDLINLIYEIKKDINDIHLDLIGDGVEYNSLKQLIKKLKLEDNITMHGFKNKEEIDNIIKNDSLYVMTSHTESFGIVLIEAMSYGLPCIAFNSAQGACEVISQKELLIENRNINKMKDKIIALLNNKKELKKIGLENYEISKKYLSSNVKEDWKKILK